MRLDVFDGSWNSCRLFPPSFNKADAHPPQPETVNVPVWVTTSPRYDGTGDGYESEHREKLISEETHDLSIHVQSPDFGETTVLTMAFLLAISSPVNYPEGLLQKRFGSLLSQQMSTVLTCRSVPRRVYSVAR